MKVDSRIIKTKNALKQSLIDILQEKNFEGITIQEICQKAHVTRVTFYAHYSDKQALLIDYINGALNDIFSFSIDLNTLSLKERLTYSIISIFYKTLEKISTLSNFKRIFVDNGDSAIAYLLQMKTMQVCIEKLNLVIHDNYLNRPTDLIAAFLVGGLTQMIYYYLKSNEEISIDDLRSKGAIILNSTLKALIQ